MNIGQAARASGLSAKMIRYYESIGLIAPVGRTAAGYRVYADQEVQMLRFVRRARELGFPAGRIAQLMTLWRDKGRASAAVKQIALAQIAALDARIAELVTMQRTLHQLADHCQGDGRPDCPILDDLADGPARIAGTVM